MKRYRISFDSSKDIEEHEKGEWCREGDVTILESCYRDALEELKDSKKMKRTCEICKKEKKIFFVYDFLYYEIPACKICHSRVNESKNFLLKTTGGFWKDDAIDRVKYFYETHIY